MAKNVPSEHTTPTPRGTSPHRPRTAALLRVLIALMTCAGLSLEAWAAEEISPAFHLSFDQGLRPDIGPDQEGTWEGEKPPKYETVAPLGKALLIDNTDPSPRVSFDAPANAQESGTLLFWSKGIEKVKLYNTVFKGAAGQSSNFLAFWGSEGWGRIRKWEYDTRGVKLQMPNRQVFFPRFDPYAWTQLGFSWHDGKVRLFLNGALVAERNNFPLAIDRLAFGGNMGEEGTRRVLDNLKIWNRPLTESEVKRVYRRDLTQRNSPLVSVPYLNTPPDIDGVVKRDEWEKTASLTGMLDAGTGELASEQSTFYLGYTDEFLFVAMIGDLTTLARTAPEQVYGKFLNAEHKGRSPALTGDDRVEIVLSPDYWNTDADHWTEYRITGNNAGGYTAEACTANGEDRDTTWAPQWETAANVSPEGWHFEARIPLASFEKTVHPGDEWGLQLGRIWEHLLTRHDLWSWGHYPPLANGTVETRHKESGTPLHVQAESTNVNSSFGVLRFAEKEAPIVRVEKTGALPDKQIDVSTILANPADKEQRVTVKLFTDTDELQQEEEIMLPPGETVAFGRTGKIVDPLTSKLTFTVTDAEEQLLHKTCVPFCIEQSFGLKVIQYPNYDKFLVELDLSIMSGLDLEQLRVDMTLTDAEGNMVYHEENRAIDSYTPVFESSSAGFEVGSYTLSTRIREGDTVVAEDKRTYPKKPKAVWWDNDYGYRDMRTDVVPYPWTDMKVKEETVSAWGRDYRFGTGIFPEQITTLDRPLLRGPIRMLVKTSQGNVLDTAASNSRRQWTRTDRTRVEGIREVEGGDFTLRNELWAEYDGLVWNRLTIDPEKNIEIVSIELEMPLTAEFTDVINTTNYGLRGTGKLKPEGFTSSPLTKVWLGNGTGGMQWFCETLGWFFVEEPGKALRVEVEDGAATLRVTMIDQPTTFEAPHSLEFGFIATPVRPKINRTPYFRPRSTAGGGPWFPKGLEFMPAADPGRNYYSSGRIYVHLNPVNTGFDASGTHDFRDYGYEWLQSASFRYSGEHTVMPTQASKSYRDYFVWRHWRYQKKYGYAGLYYDGFAPLPSANRYVGAGYVDRNGDVHTETPILEARDVVKRLYNITLSNQLFGAREQAIGIHQSGQPNMALAGFCTYNWNAENLNSKIGESQPSYIGVVDPAVYRAEYYGHNFAWPVMFLGQARILSKWMEQEGSTMYVDHIQGLDLLHDTPPSGWHVSGPWAACVNRAIETARKHHFTHWTYQFIPYWEQEIVQLPHEELYASFYIARPSSLLPALDSSSSLVRSRAIASYIRGFEHLPGHIKDMLRYDARKQARWLKTIEDKAILIVYNNSDWEGELRLKPNWQKLGLGAPETLTADNAVHSVGFRVEKTGEKDKDGKEIERAVFFDRPEEYAKIENGQLVFPITRFNYRMIVLEKNETSSED